MWLRNYVSSMCLFIFHTNLTRAMFVLCNKGQDICFHLLLFFFFNCLCLGIVNMTQGPLSELSYVFYIMIFLCYLIIRWQISAFNRGKQITLLTNSAHYTNEMISLSLEDFVTQQGQIQVLQGVYGVLSWQKSNYWFLRIGPGGGSMFGYGQC